MYKVIPEFPRWEIDNRGHIRNVMTRVDKFVYVNVQGYVEVAFKKDGKRHSKKVHRIVGQLFLPPPSKELHALCEGKWPYKPCINHIDHDKTNNNSYNLEWCDIAHNNKAALAAGVIPPLKSSLNGRATLTEDLVHKICQSYEKGMKPKEAEQVFHISRSQSTKIKAGIQWKHIWEQYDIKVNRHKKKVIIDKSNDHEGDAS